MGLLVAVLLWHSAGVIAMGAPAETNLPVIVRKAAPDRQSPDRPRNDAPQAKLYFGSRLESVTSTVAPQNPYESDYASFLHAYHKAIIGFRLALTSRTYLFVGVGMAIPDELLDQWWVRNTSFTATQLQDVLVMQTEYGLGWDF